jgi:putative OPT family oligopeptide transporter
MSTAAAEKPPPPESHGEVFAKPLDTHPDGRPMTQEEIDRHWLTHVYRPNEPQLTPRAIVTGMLLGGVMSLSNLYVGLKTGWGLAVTVTAAVLAFGIFTSLRKVIPRGPFAREFTSLENNTMASAASAAGYFTGAGLTSAVPALFMATGQTIAPIPLALWILAVSFLGVFLAIPMRRQMIDVDRLPFPEGLAYAETIRSLHSAPGEARKKALALLWGAIAGAGVKFLSGVTGLAIGTWRWALSHSVLPETLPLFEKWHPLTLGLQSDILMIGAGAIMGVRVCAGLAVGAILGWGVLAVWLHTHGLAGAAPTFATVRTWIVWPGVTLIVVNGLLSFGLKWRTAVAALSGLGKLASGKGMGGMSEVEVPGTWFIRGTLACIAFVVILAKVLFDIPVWMGLIGALMSVVLSIVACRATGETSITPIGALGKITQFMYGGMAAGNITTNLMTASITAGAAMHSADLLTDLKGGYVLGSKPRHQFFSQFFGIVAGAVFCIPAYAILATPERLGSVEFPAPSAKTWQAVAELLAGGIDRVARGEAEGAAAAISGVAVNLVPVGTRPGDRVKIGNDTANYVVRAVVDKVLVLDSTPGNSNPEEVKNASVRVHDPSGALRGSATAVGLKPLAALWLNPMPEGTTKGDYLRHEVNGHDLWWVVKGRVDEVVVVDRPIVDPRGETPSPMPPTFRVEVRKESLPPYALESVIIAAILAMIFTLAEVFGSSKLRPFVPSSSGLGLGFVVAGFDSISMLIGSVLAWGLEKWKPKLADDFTLAGASGVMAGASLAGILIIVLSQIAKVLVTP